MPNEVTVGARHSCFDPRVQDPRHALVGTLALLAATVATLFGLALAEPETGSELAAAGEPEPAAAEPAPALDPDRLLELGVARTPAVARRVEAIRELRFERVPVPGISDVADLRRIAERDLDRPGVAEGLEAADAALRLLGLQEGERSLAEVAGDVTAGAVAYYHPARDELFLVGDAVPAGPQLAEFILSHELTHALEDQRFGLPRSHGLSNDRTLAQTALVEGTATALMIEYARLHLDPLALAAELEGLGTGASGELPRFAEAEVEFTYLEGGEFVEELVRLADGWTVVDYAYTDRAPETTEQVLHPEKYLDDEPPLPVAPPSAPGPGWRVVDEGGLGEFGTREVLRSGEPGLGADRAAAGWGGDRYRLFARTGAENGCDDECRSTHALGIRWRGDSRDDARQLAAELRTYVVAGLDGSPAGNGGWRLDGGAAAVALAEDEVGLGLAPDAASARALARVR
jgi:hypothetical protein